MPYSNEHSARLQEPNKFDPATYRRKNGGTIYGRIKVPVTIAIIWAKLRRRNKPKDMPIPQSLRFPIKKWTAAKARNWLKDNKIKYIRFESAKPKEKTSMSNEDKNKLENTVPLTACIFNDCAQVTFEEHTAEQKKDKFRIVAYSGGVLKHFWFGSIAFDLKGLKFAKKCTPILESHDKHIRIGYSTKQKVNDNVVVEGNFLPNPKAQELMADLQAGLPMEASLLVVPSVVEKVTEGASLEVNGHRLKGPGVVFRKATIKEASMCPFGLDSNTSSQALAANVGAGEKIKFSIVNEEKTKMSSEMTIETFADEHPDIHGQVFDKGKADGEKAERDLFGELEVACAGDLELLVQCYKEGKTKEETLQMHSAKLEKANTELKAKLEELNTVKTEKKDKVDAAEAEFSDNAVDAENVSTEKSTGEEAWKKEFAASKDLQEEFGSEEIYLAYKKADDKGQVKIL